MNLDTRKFWLRYENYLGQKIREATWTLESQISHAFYLLRNEITHKVLFFPEGNFKRDRAVLRLTLVDGHLKFTGGALAGKAAEWWLNRKREQK